MESAKMSDAMTQAIQVVMKGSSYYLSRSFFNVQKCRTATNIVNRLFENEPELEPTLLALSLLPVMDWMLGAKNLDAMSSVVFGHVSDNIMVLDRTKELIADILDGRPRLTLQRREEYFNHLTEIVQYVKSKIVALGSFPKRGKTYAALIRYFYLGESTDIVTITAHNINNFLPDAIRVLHSMMRERISELVGSVLLDTVPDDQDTELQYVYHNTMILLEEYAKIKWSAQNADDKAVQLLACDTQEEMLKLTESDTKYSQAYIIVQYIILIHNAIERLQTFPMPEVYTVVKASIEKKQMQYSDSDIAIMLKMPMTKYRMLVRAGMAALSAELYGTDCNVFLDMLID